MSDPIDSGNDERSKGQAAHSPDSPPSSSTLPTHTCTETVTQPSPTSESNSLSSSQSHSLSSSQQQHQQQQQQQQQPLHILNPAFVMYIKNRALNAKSPPFWLGIRKRNRTSNEVDEESEGEEGGEGQRRGREKKPANRNAASPHSSLEQSNGNEIHLTLLSSFFHTLFSPASLSCTLLFHSLLHKFMPFIACALYMTFLLVLSAFFLFFFFFFFLFLFLFLTYWEAHLAVPLILFISLSATQPHVICFYLNK